MKLSCAVVAFVALAFPCQAGTVVISDTSTILPGVARQTTTILVNSGAPIKQTAKDLYVVAANGLHCQARSNDAVDFTAPESGLETYSCRVNSENTLGTTKGQPFGDAGAIRQVLAAIEDKMGDKVAFTDAAMGQSSTYAKLISCTIHTNIENMENAGRWECSFTDGQ
jgi:hypothetical protein